MSNTENENTVSRRTVLSYIAWTAGFGVALPALKKGTTWIEEQDSNHQIINTAKERYPSLSDEDAAKLEWNNTVTLFQFGLVSGLAARMCVSLRERNGATDDDWPEMGGPL